MHGSSERPWSLVGIFLGDHLSGAIDSWGSSFAIFAA